MSEITIRRAQSADLEQVAPLFDAYRQFYRLAGDGEGARRFMRDRLENRDSVVFLASSAGRPVGFVQLYPVFSSLQMRPALILNDLYVAQPYRKHGAARRLMEEAKKHAIGVGACSLILETAPDNSAARKLYESLGYKLEQGFLQYVLSVA